MNEQQETDYRQELGLKKILYKYQNQNQQLRSQIKALNQRLEYILNKPKTPLQKPILDPIQEYQGQLLKEKMNKLYKEINHQSLEMKINKDSIDLRHEQKCRQLEDKIIKEEKEIKDLNYKLQKYDKIDEGLRLQDLTKHTENPASLSPSLALASVLSQNKLDGQVLMMSNNKTLRTSTMRVQNYLQKLNAIKEETQQVRKSIKQLENQRNNNQKNLIKKHLFQTDFKEQNRTLENGPKIDVMVEETPVVKKKGVWAMENTKENYQFIKGQLQKLKREKDSTLETIKNENIVLANKVKQLEMQLEGLNNSVEIPPLPFQKRQLKIPVELSLSTKIQTPLLQKKSLKPIDLGPTQFQRKNDKNFIPKMLRRVQWQSTKNSQGIQWNDSQVKSPIIGLNLWFDGHLTGIEVLHEAGSSGQQIQVLGGKKIVPIQYRLGTGDYLENVVIYISEGLIYRIELLSKNGRVDKFGNSAKGRKFDFGIKGPERPVISLGQYRIRNQVSEITKLGFQVI